MSTWEIPASIPAVPSAQDSPVWLPSLALSTGTGLDLFVRDQTSDTSWCCLGFRLIFLVLVLRGWEVGVGEGL